MNKNDDSIQEQPKETSSVIENQINLLQNDKKLDPEEDIKIKDNLKISSIAMTTENPISQEKTEEPEEEEFKIKIIKRKDPPIMPKPPPVPEIIINETEPVIKTNDISLIVNEEQPTANPLVVIRLL